MAGISPEDNFTYWLPDDASKPESERRGLVYAHRSVRDWRKFVADREAAVKSKDIDAIDTAFIELASRGLVRLINIEAVDCLTSTQLIDLTGRLRLTSWMGTDEKKDSPSPAPSVPESSAPSASPASA